MSCRGQSRNRKEGRRTARITLLRIHGSGCVASIRRDMMQSAKGDQVVGSVKYPRVGSSSVYIRVVLGLNPTDPRVTHLLHAATHLWQEETYSRRRVARKLTVTDQIFLQNITNGKYAAHLYRWRVAQLAHWATGQRGSANTPSVCSSSSSSSYCSTCTAVTRLCF